MLVQRSQVGSVIGRGGYKIKETREVYFIEIWLERLIETLIFTFDYPGTF